MTGDAPTSAGGTRRPGSATGEFGRSVAAMLQERGVEQQYHLFYDHGDPSTDPCVAAAKGVAGTSLSQQTRLADIDLVLATPEGKVVLLIEIEERPLSPKKLLGDLFTLLLCDRVAVRREGVNHFYEITPETRLVIAGITPDKGSQRAKYEEVILPRAQQVSGLPSGIPMSQVTLVLGETLEQMIERLKAEVWGVVGRGNG
jgi:hypothetical protein